MLASTIITDVRRELLETTGVTWNDTELLRLLNRGELDYVNKTRILEDQAYLTLVQGRSDYKLPDNWVSTRLILQNLPDLSGNNDWKRIYPSNLEKIAQEQPNLLDDTASTQSRPRKYYIWQRTLFVKPSPDSQNATQLWMWYKSKPIPLLTTGDSINIDDSLSEAINFYILWKAWAKVREYDSAAEAKANYFEMVGEGRRWVKKESGDQRFRIDIDSPVGFAGGLQGFSPLQP